MKVVILAGGLGTRLSEETTVKPKPMVEIGGRPILWHIMKLYSSYGLNEFVICCGYKGYMIKEFFANYFMHMSDLTIDIANNKITTHSNHSEPWKITLVDTGEDTMTGGRVKRVRQYVGNETFCMTYGDGISDVNLREEIEFHKSHGKYATMLAVQPPGRFGVLNIDEGNRVESFQEKPSGDGTHINGGFFVLEPEIFRYLKDDQTIWERFPLESLAKEGQLYSFRHDGFWYPMDTLRDKIKLEELWQSQKAPWKVW
ncbi:MAG TPA: glucose-1-phosphate cytidylyltransferase [Candidatus Ozemobacteraceae bacterium]|nr:glucose-1-phosphate cytidylyltransferase [Candidatus Ozemobacteraceae bacterium]